MIAAACTSKSPVEGCFSGVEAAADVAEVCSQVPGQYKHSFWPVSMEACVSQPTNTASAGQ